MKDVFAIVWRQTGSQEEFEARIPKLMEWLRDLKHRNILLSCGGGGWDNDMSGGLTIIDVATPEEAERIAREHPMDDIGTTELFWWSVFWSNFSYLENEEKLA